MNDQDTSVSQLREIIRHFVDEREWNQFHSPKNLSMALVIEASELMEHFQWLTIDESRTLKNDPQKLAAVGEELADVLSYTLALANSLELDLSSTIRAKMKKNEKKYPAEEYRGRHGPADNADQ